MKKVLIAIFFASLVCFLVGSVQAYTNGRYGFSIEPPSGWTVEEPSYAAVVFLGPMEEGFTVNVIIQVESTSVSLDQYISAAKQSLQTLENFALISEGPRTINNVNAYELVFTFRYSGVVVQQKQVWLVKNGKAFGIAYTVLPSKYQTYLTVFENSVQTFQIGSQAPTGGTFLGLEWWLWVIIIAVIVGVAVAAGLMLRRKKPPVTPLPLPQPQQPPTP